MLRAIEQIRRMRGAAGVEAVPMEAFAVRTAKMRPMIQ
jgi:Na+-transporting methylmalonyl-CoA/oxaloacetate decarboxylase beta subunit